MALAMVAPRIRDRADALEDLVQRIVHAVAPRRIVLFGSAARGDTGPHSDLDVLVILPDGADPVASELAIYRKLWGLRFGADIIAVTETDAERLKSNPFVVIHTALAEGKELYRAAG
jgi:predicted nucleotidyltransferase